MKDRISTQVLSNGALRYGIYDEEGNLLRYEYIKPEDEPVEGYSGTDLNKRLFDYAFAAIGETTGSATALVLDGDGGFTLVDGATIMFKLHVDSGANATINVNDTGSKNLMQDATKPMKAGIKAGTWCVATYSDTLGFFVLRGSGDSVGRFGNKQNQISTYELAFRGQWSSNYSARF